MCYRLGRTQLLTNYYFNLPDINLYRIGRLRRLLCSHGRFYESLEPIVDKVPLEKVLTARGQIRGEIKNSMLIGPRGC